jgi:hypothetical protein
VLVLLAVTGKQMPLVPSEVEGRMAQSLYRRPSTRLGTSD